MISPRFGQSVAWAYEAKHRAVLLFLRKRHGLAVAYLANAIMLAGQLPRLLAWLLADLARGRRGGWVELSKARALWFHASALLRPARIDDSWEKREMG